MPKREFLNPEEEPVADSAAIPDEVVLVSSQERPALFGLLVERYQPSFLRVAERVVRDRGAAEDVVQEAFVKMYRYAKRFKKGEDRKVSSWAYKIVLNTAITHYHRLRRREWQLPDPAASGTDPTADQAQENFREATLNRETEAVVSGVLEVLPPDLALLLRAYYLEDKSYRVIAEAEGLSIGALKMKLFRARKLFKKRLISS